MDEQTGPVTGHDDSTTGTSRDAAAGGTRTDERPTYGGGPRVSAEQARDVARLRRSRTDRYVAGVAGGLGRHFDVDPTVVRVLLAVLTLFGGAGVLVYAAVWLFVPEDGSDRAPVDVGPDTRRVILVVAAALALMIVFGSPFVDGSWGWSFPFPLLVLAVVGIVVLTTRQRRDRRSATPPAPWGPPSPAQAAPAAPSWAPPAAPAYAPAPRPRRTGPVLFWPTLALVAIALGTLGIVDVSSSVPAPAYAALALTVVGLVLLVGAFVGRPGGLIALGLVTAGALVVTSAVTAATGGSTRDEDVRVAPTSAAGVRSAYYIGTGSIVVDLSGVRDVAALDGRSLSVTGKAAEIRVVLPPGVNADVAARVRYVGVVDLGSSSRGGFDLSTSRTLTSSTTPGTPTLDLDLAVRAGRITVEQR